MTDLPSKEQVLLKALKYLARHYVGQLENARDRIVSLGGQCDAVDVMERGDPHLRQVREVIASIEASPPETRAALTECPYCKRPADSDGSIWHAGGCAGLEKVDINRLEYERLVPQSSPKTGCSADPHSDLPVEQS